MSKLNSKLLLIGSLSALVVIGIFLGITLFSQEETIQVEEYLATFNFEVDELGNYENRCLQHNGDWLEGYDCGFKTTNDHK